MTSSLNERENAFENKFAHDEQLRFRVEARACKAFGLWLAEQLGLTGDAAATYASQTVESNLDAPGLDDVLDKAETDLQAQGKTADRHALKAKLDECVANAKQQVMSETNI